MMYIVENKYREVWGNGGYFSTDMSQARVYDEPIEPEEDARNFGGYVVKLMEMPQAGAATQSADLVAGFAAELVQMQDESYRAFVKALVQNEGCSLSDERYEEWSNSEWPLLSEPLMQD